MNNNTATLHTLNADSVANQLKRSQSVEDAQAKCIAIADLATIIKEKVAQSERVDLDQVNSLASAIVDMVFAVSDGMDDIADTAQSIASKH
ncbi:MAG: hypothetical protein B0D91_05775 [Oceanospirillales bacterium LUC14_002_19_P2]|nr:MAG: hypothetical protein B0D91_05775 [Oceanospirillales bacterium LUC14_002_19_P2]